MSKEEFIIETQQLEKKYITDTVETTALAGVDLRIAKGEFVAVMGPSGCGKSTLLNILGLLDSPSSGTFRFLGQDISHASERQRAKIRKQNLGFVFQSFNLIDELTVEENISLPLDYLGIPRAEASKRVKEAMERMGIAHRHAHFPQQLSGGQQQRVAIARATVSDPSLILADEPTGNLDSVHGREVMSLLSELNDAGTTVVMVTHSPSDAEYAHRIVNLFDGQIVTESLNARRQAAELL
ncbi:ABC transporter ATP-binding protein [Pontibacter sp. BT731]|uniref:ABC transporter ATP-binding protein n=1 Tax=Pontibacter coccineus TaxID=3063328 RepID=UPI0026E15B20|nr:ABC transporter ATP-binding protein [Pontibacter sp. BT731]MDO6390343.1 ABC transporter ATP-binding protein [Pontibacter sp. BT731]